MNDIHQQSEVSLSRTDHCIVKDLLNSEAKYVCDLKLINFVSNSKYICIYHIVYHKGMYLHSYCIVLRVYIELIKLMMLALTFIIIIDNFFFVLVFLL